ncbi:MAG TPA: ADYC domain-containing protein [Kofleriaceae bacterium]|nr:ADYC domain-containing protein [Kofleriaceae bacterium]
MWVLSLTACAVDVELTETTQAIVDDGGCPTWGCGGNSPEIDTYGFHELHELGAQNLEGFWIESVSRYGTPYDHPDVTGSTLVVRNADGSVAVSANNIDGTIMRIRHALTGNLYELRVTAHARMPYWADPTVTTPTYLLEWRQPIPDPSGTMPAWRNVCSHPGGINTDGWINPGHAVLFDDDRIDAEHKIVTGQARNWFNIGCAGHALAKQHLTGHTRAASATLGISTTYADRTANLKMLAADYCGTGHAFTVAGIDLHWRDRYGWYSTIGYGEAIEARWTESGASCLNTPRVIASPTSLSVERFGTSLSDFQDALRAEGCLPRPCTPSTWGLAYPYDGAHVVSANY